MPDGVALPPSLKNVYKEISNDLTIDLKSLSKTGNLIKWCNQGVLLLNSVLTVRLHLANSHKQKGWELFTDECINFINKQNRRGIILGRCKHVTHPAGSDTHIELDEFRAIN